MFKNSTFWHQKDRDFSLSSGVYTMSELDASNDTERSNKIEILISPQKLLALIHMTLDLVSIIVPKIKIGVFYP